MSFSVSVVHPAASSNTMGTGQNYLPSQHCGPSCRFHKQIRRKKGQKRFPAASNTGCQNRRNKREEKKDPEKKKKKDPFIQQLWFILQLVPPELGQ